MSHNVISLAESALRNAAAASSLADVLQALPDGTRVIVPTSAHRRLVQRLWAAQQPTRDVPQLTTMAGFIGGLAKMLLPPQVQIIDDVEASVLLDLAMADAAEMFRPARLSIPLLMRWKQEQYTVDLVEHQYADAEGRPVELRDIDRVIRIWRAYEQRKGDLVLDRGDVGFVIADVMARTEIASDGVPTLILGTHGLTTIDRTILHLLARSGWDLGIWFMPHLDEFNRSTDAGKWLISHGWLSTNHQPSDHQPPNHQPQTLLRAWSSPREEVRRAVAAAKELITKGTSMRDIAIVAPMSGSYDALLADAAMTSGLPIEITASQPLSTHRISTAVLAACQIVIGRWQRSDVERLALCGQIGVDHDLGRLIEAAVQHRINGGDGAMDWAQRLDAARTRLQTAADGEDDKRLRAGLAMLSKARTTFNLLQRLLTPPGEQHSARQFATWIQDNVIGAMGLETIDELLSTLDRYVVFAERHNVDHARFIDHVQRWWTIVDGTSIAAWSGADTGVRVMRPSEIRLHSFSAVFVLGVIDGELPTDEGDPIDEALMEGLRQHIDREQFSDLFHGGNDGSLLILSRPIAIDGDPTLTSIYFREVADWPTTIMPDKPCGIEALDTADHLLLLDAQDDLAYRSGSMLDMSKRQQGIISTDLTPSAAALFAQSISQPLNPSRLDVVIGCPYAYFGRRILGLDEPITGDEQLTPLERGTLMHATAQTFFDTVRGYPVVDVRTKDDIASALIDLTTHPESHWFPILLDIFEQQRATLPSGYLYDEAEHRAFYGTDDRPGLLARWLSMEYTFQRENRARPLLFELEIDSELILEGGVVVPVRLRIDRVDAEIVDGEVVVTVIDYKTSASGVPSKKRVERGEATQMPLYLAAVRSWFAERGMDVVAREASYHTFGRSLRTTTDPAIKSMELEYDEILTTVEPAIAALSDGIFPVRPTDKACRYCGLNEICRIESWGPLEEKQPI